MALRLRSVDFAGSKRIRAAYDDDFDKLVDMILYLFGGRGILLRGAAALYVAVQFWKTL